MNKAHIKLEGPVYIDLFAGCGGLSLGLKKAGWQGLFAVEKSSDAFETLKHNLIDAPESHFDWPEWLQKTPHTLEQVIKDHSEDLKSYRNKVDLIAGGPPCQGFSTVGKRNSDDPRNKLYKSYLKFVELVQPKMVLLENVRGIQYKFLDGETGRAKKTPHSEIIKKALGKNYHVTSDVIYAKDFGVPQTRPRYILIGIRKEVENWTPIETLNPIEALKESREAFLRSKNVSKTVITAREALSDLHREGSKLIACQEYPRFQQGHYGKQYSLYQKLMHGSMNGAVADSHRFARHNPSTVEKFSWFLENCAKGKKIRQEDRGEYKNKKHTIHILHPDECAPTVTTLPDDMLHYCEPRILTVRETARLQSFPDWYEFKGKYTTGGSLRKKECPRYTQVGNAVPPLLAEAIGRLLLNVIRSH
jgi:DNA (cytosine-5)-methyltransferase 1